MPASHASKSPDCIPPQFLEIEDLEEETEKVHSPREMLEKDQMAQPVDESNNTTSQLKFRVESAVLGWLFHHFWTLSIVWRRWGTQFSIWSLRYSKWREVNESNSIDPVSEINQIEKRLIRH